jgi:hypothetical protein
MNEKTLIRTMECLQESGSCVYKGEGLLILPQELQNSWYKDRYDIITHKW